MSGGFAAALLSVVDIDSASGDELLEAAERLAANREEREAREKNRGCGGNPGPLLVQDFHRSPIC